jgi:alkylated DNA repair protein alkB homolog 6
MDAPAAQAVALPCSLEHVKIKRLAPSAYYIANFLSEEEEQVILDKVGSRRGGISKFTSRR